MSNDRGPIEQVPSERSKIPVTLWKEDPLLIDCQVINKQHLIHYAACACCQLSLQTNMQSFG